MPAASDFSSYTLRATERGMGANCYRVSRSKGPHHTPCFEVQGASYSKPVVILQRKILDLENLCSLRLQEASPFSFAPGPLGSLGGSWCMML